MANKTASPAKRRVRARLLIMLWVWAALVFVVVDLFRNVSAFDDCAPSIAAI